jgi:TetR/AcrR family transcriptional regulator, transcriptional repressor for nem operon
MSTRVRNPEETRRRLIAAATRLMLRQGYASTTVDQICEESGLTKGAFFHHYSSKEELTRAAVSAWGEMGAALYADAWLGAETDPLAQLHRMIDIMVSFTTRPDEPCVCMVGMMSQELGRTHPEMRDACGHELAVWTSNVARLLAEAKRIHPVKRDFDPEQVAWFLNSLWQGSMLVGKVRENPAIIRENLQLARDFVDGLFQATNH